MIINFDDLKAAGVYHIMTQTIVPRPIAWILTDSGDSSYNLAPFSYFNAICSDPPLVMLSIGMNPGGALKDTRVNLLEKRQLVIHIPKVEHAAQVTESSRTLPFGESEVDRLGMALVQEEDWVLPRLADAPVAMACELYEVHEIGPGKQGIFFCKVNQIYVDDAVVKRDEKNRLAIDAAGIQPLGRLGASEYVTFGDVFKIPRPD